MGRKQQQQRQQTLESFLEVLFFSSLYYF